LANLDPLRCGREILVARGFHRAPGAAADQVVGKPEAHGEQRQRHQEGPPVVAQGIQRRCRKIEIEALHATSPLLDRPPAQELREGNGEGVSDQRLCP
jgi:hypothetical protein